MKDPATSRAWADHDADDQDDARMELDHLQPVLDETAGDFSDEDSSPSAPAAPAVARTIILSVFAPRAENTAVTFV